MAENLPKFQSVRLVAEDLKIISDSIRELNRNLEWMFDNINRVLKSLDERIIDLEEE